MICYYLEFKIDRNAELVNPKIYTYLNLLDNFLRFSLIGTIPIYLYFLREVMGKRF